MIHRWNENGNGFSGEPGVPGPAGSIGQKGEPGYDGIPGTAGAKGEQGTVTIVLCLCVTKMHKQAKQVYLREECAGFEILYPWSGTYKNEITTTNYWLSSLCEADDTDEQLCLIDVIMNNFFFFSQKLVLV